MSALIMPRAVQSRRPFPTWEFNVSEQDPDFLITLATQARDRVAAIDVELGNLKARLEALGAERTRLVAATRALRRIAEGEMPEEAAPPPPPEAPPEVPTAAPKPDGGAPRGPITEEAVRDFILAHKREPFTRHHFLAHFGLASTSTSVVPKYLAPFIAKGMLEELPREQWIKHSDRPDAKPSFTYRYVKPEPSEVPLRPNGAENAEVSGVASPVVVEPVGGTGKKSQVKLPPDVVSLLSKVRPKPEVEYTGSGHYRIVHPTKRPVGLSHSPSDVNYLHSVRRKLREAGYHFPVGA